MTTTAYPMPARDRRELDERARAHLRAERRRRLVRRLAVVLAFMLTLLGLAIVNRDTQNLRGFRVEAEQIASAMQAIFDSSRVAATRFPDLGQRYAHARGRYDFNVLHVEQLRMRKPVAVCRMNHPVRLAMRSDGYFFIVFDGATYAVLWVPLTEYEQRCREFDWPPSASS